MTDLKPCPFCGGGAIATRIGNNHTKSRATEIRCAKCNVRRKIAAIRNTLDWTHEQAITAWNTRAPSPVGDLVKALEACAADWKSPPCTVAEGAYYLSREFARRAEIARAALAHASESQSTKSIGGAEGVANASHPHLQGDGE